MIDETAFAQQIGVGQRIHAHEHPWPESERAPGARPVGLALDRPAHCEGDSANREGVAHGEIETLRERGVDERSPRRAGPRERRLQANGHAIVSLRFEPPDQRISRIHRLELDEHACLDPGAPRHAVHLHEVGERRGGVFQVLAIGRGEIAIQRAQYQVAAEDLPAVGAQAGDDRVGGRQHPGDGRNAEREAAEKDPESA